MSLCISNSYLKCRSGLMPKFCSVLFVFFKNQYKDITKQIDDNDEFVIFQRKKFSLKKKMSFLTLKSLFFCVYSSYFYNSYWY